VCRLASVARSTDSGSKDAGVWGHLLEIAGAAIGLAAVISLLGAASVWMRVAGSGYSAEEAVAHEPRSVLIGSGLRGLLALGCLALVAVVAGLLARAAVTRLDPRSDVRRRANPGFLPKWLRFSLAGVAAVGVMVAALGDWRILALTVACAAPLLFIALSFRGRDYWFAVLAASLVATISWLYGTPANVSSVTLIPRKQLPIEGLVLQSTSCARPGGEVQENIARFAWVDGEQLWLANRICETRKGAFQPRKFFEMVLEDVRHCSVPFFGEDGGRVYLGAFRSVWRDEGNFCHWEPGPIVQRRSARVRLRILDRGIEFGGNNDRPVVTGWRALQSFLKG
jgi:hypothetical protein